MSLTPEVGPKVVGFLEEAPGVKSSTRLFSLFLLALAFAFTGAIIWYVWFSTMRRRAPDAGVIGGLVAGLTAVVAQGVVAIVNRTSVCPPGVDHDAG